MSYPTDHDQPADADVAEVLSTMHAGEGHVFATNRMLAKLLALGQKLGLGASTASANTVLRGTGAGATAFGQVQTGDLAADAVSQVGFATGLTSGPSASSTSFATLDGNGPSNQLAVTLTTTGGDLEVICVVTVLETATAGNGFILALALDGASEVARTGAMSPFTNGWVCLTTVWRFTGVAAGAHTVRARYAVTAGTWQLQATNRYLLVRERKR